MMSGTAVMFRPLLMGLPVHAASSLVVYLHAVHATVALVGIRIAREYQRQRDEPASILGPALQNRVIEKREAVVLDDFLARTFAHDLRKEGAHLRQLG